MAEVSCTKHPQVGAVGKCSRCEKPFCLDCLDIDTGKPLCPDCLSGKSTPQTAPPVFAPPIHINPVPVVPPQPKVKEDILISMDDLNIEMKTPVENKAEEKSEPIKADLPSAVLPVFKPIDNDPLGLFKGSSAMSVPETAKPVAQNPSADLPVPFREPKPFESSPVLTFPTSSAPLSDKPAHVSNFDLAGMMNKLDAAEKTMSKSPAFDPTALVPDQDKVSVRDLHAPPNKLFYNLNSFAGALWLKINIFAAKFKIPGYLLAAIVFVLLAGGITVISQFNSAPVVALVDSVPAIHIIPVDVSQVADMDITAFSDLQNHLGSLGFTQVLQMTVLQLPAPNFFDVGVKEDVGTYSEILKMPNQIGPRVSFVTVFSNGVWYSTNGWAGTNQQLDYLVSEFYPDQTPEQLYNQHLQGIQKLQTDNGWQVQKAGLNRYMAALTDHLRWFLTFKKIFPYQADFASWH